MHRVPAVGLFLLRSDYLTTPPWLASYIPRLCTSRQLSSSPSLPRTSPCPCPCPSPPIIRCQLTPYPACSRAKIANAKHPTAPDRQTMRLHAAAATVTFIQAAGIFGFPGHMIRYIFVPVILSPERQRCTRSTLM